MKSKVAPPKLKIASTEVRRIEQALEAGLPLRQVIPLQPRKVIKKSFWGIFAVLMGWAAATIALWQFYLKNAPLESSRVVWTGWVLVLLVLVLFRAAYQILYFLTYFYDVDEKNIFIRKGVIAKREITLPFKKITDVYIDQDLLDVVFALYDLHMSSPTEQSGRFAHIDGIDKRGAVQLRALLLARIHKDEEKEKDEI